MRDRVTKKGIWGWMFFDWASQPYNTLLLTFVFGPYFTSAVIGNGAEGQAQWGYMLSAVGLVIALLAPVLGAIADSSGPRKPWIWVFSVMYVAGAFALWWAVPGMRDPFWILVAFGVGMTGLAFATIFSHAILPDLGGKGEVGRISGSGWAFGYWGGIVALLVMLLFLAENEEGVTLLGNPPLFGLDPATREGTRSVGPLTAIWYAVFMVPFFLWVPDVKRKAASKGAVVRGLQELWHTLKSLPERISLTAYLGSSMLYRDALNGLFGFGGIYAAGVLGWSITEIGVFGIVAAFAGAVFAWIGGFADRRWGPKPVIVWTVVILIVVVSVIVTTSREMVVFMPVDPDSSLPDIVFYICGAAIGGAGGALQAASRTMMVRQSRKDRMTEAFGLYALSGKATAFLAPAAIAFATQMTDSQRLGMLPLIPLFVLGLLFMLWVKPDGESED